MLHIEMTEKERVVYAEELRLYKKRKAGIAMKKNATGKLDSNNKGNYRKGFV